MTTRRQGGGQGDPGDGGMRCVGTGKGQVLSLICGSCGAPHSKLSTQSSPRNFTGHTNIPSHPSLPLHLLLPHLQLDSNETSHQPSPFIYVFRHLSNVFYGECGDKNGNISTLKKFTLKLCREQSPRKSIGFAELGLDMIFAFKIFMLWDSEDQEV